MTTPATMLRLLGSIRAHLTTHPLTTPLASVRVASNLLDGEHVTVHLRPSLLPDLAAALLAWADTLTKVTVTAWRPPHGETVHLTVTGERHDATRVDVYGGVDSPRPSVTSSLADGRVLRSPFCAAGLPVRRGWRHDAPDSR